MRFTRRTLVTVLAIAALVTAGSGSLSRVSAYTWALDSPIPTYEPGTAPTSGEPDVGQTRHVIYTTEPGQSSQQTVVTGMQKVTEIRWVGWIWLSRHLGMGL